MSWLFRRTGRRAGELARIAEQGREHLFSLSLDMLCIAGFDGCFKQLNPAWETTLGIPLAELMSRPFIDFVHSDDVPGTLRETQALRLGGRTVDFENRYRTRNGSYRWLSWRATSSPAEGLIYAVARDVDERKRVEQMKDEFISVVSHELRTPLTSIRGALGLLNGGVAGELPVEVRSLVDIAARNSERLVTLINDILDMEKIGSANMQFRFAPVDLMSLVEQAVAVNSPFASSYGVEIRVVESCPGVQVQADADRMQQVLANLLSNAAKFSPRGGTVEVGVARRGERVCVSVMDRGPGIPAEFHPRVFERFAQADASLTRQQGGTGLGLSISKAIVDRHSGRIWFCSAPESGTTFFFDLPVWAEGGL